MRKWIVLGIIILAIIGYIAFKVVFPIDVFDVQGKSMEPTLKEGDRIVLDKNDKDLKRGDVIVFPDPQGRTEFLISRIVGIPNDTVEITSGKVLINGSEFRQPYIKDPTTPESKTLLGTNQYYVLGDNRLVSRDSRLFGPISRDQIDGNKNVGGKVWKREGSALIDLNK
jgi:signal peptidase I